MANGVLVFLFVTSRIFLAATDTPAVAGAGSTALRVAKEADEARRQGDLDRAASLLTGAERELRAPNAPLLRVRALLARDRGLSSEAVELFGRAADLDSASDARIEQAATLVPLGRWPEAVEVLRQAFDERGMSLRVAALMDDARFSALVGFAPFQALLDEVRAEQTGPFGGILLRLGKLNEEARASRAVIEAFGHWMEATDRLLSDTAIRVLILSLMGLLFALGLAQTGLLRPPWTLLAGWLAASGVWLYGARVACGSVRSGLETVAVSAAVWGMVILMLVAARRWGRRK